MESKFERIERSLFGVPSERNIKITLETLDFAFHINSPPTLFIFRFVSEHCLRSTLRYFAIFFLLVSNALQFDYLD